MRVRSHDSLDFELAWRRTLNWAQGGRRDVRDRLPFELMARIYRDSGPPRVSTDHHPFPVTLVTGTKKSGTSRAFARLSPLDTVLYQALVDRLAPDIEGALPPRDVVFSYRQNLAGDDDAFAGTPDREAYEHGARDMLESFDEHGYGYAITADVAGYFLQIDVSELERQLYEISTENDVVRDLAALLRVWQTLGIRGLPQGVRPSSPLGNLYLAPLDRLLIRQGVKHVRWMDDLVIAVPAFHEARRTQDEMERHLYDYGLTLAADKTRIMRWDTAIEATEGAQTHLDRVKRDHRAQAQAWLEEALAWTDYPPTADKLPDPATLDQEAVIDEYDKLLETLDADELPKGIGSVLVAIFRDLQSLKVAHRLDQLPLVLTRVPDVTGRALDYLVVVARDDLATANAVYAELLSATHFMRDFEKLALCGSVLHLPERKAMTLATPLSAWALEDPHPLIRARALLAWGAQSPQDEFSIVDSFWSTAIAAWRPYALVAIQNKSKGPRDDRLERWSSDGRFLGRLAHLLRTNGVAWRKL